MRGMKDEETEKYRGYGDFSDELPTLRCTRSCHSCSATQLRLCAPEVPKGERESAWDERTEPQVVLEKESNWDDIPTIVDGVPAFIANFDDDYILNPDLGGEA